MDKERFRLHLALLFADGARMPDIPPHVQVHRLGVQRARHAVVAIASLGWKLKPDVIVSTSAHLNTAVVAARPLMPRKTAVLTREGADIVPLLTLQDTSRRGAMLARARVQIYKQVYRRADLVVCQTDYMKDDLIRRFELPPAKVKRIYNPVDIEHIAALSTLEPNPYIPPAPNLVAVGRFSYEKGFDLLIRAMSLVRQSVPTASLTLVGDGPDVFDLHAAQRQLQLEHGVSFVGSQRNPYPYIRHAHLLVLPSRCEALPNVVLEALALGTPVVSTKCTGAIEEILRCTSLMRVAAEITPGSLASEIIAAVTGTSALHRRAGAELQFAEQFDARVVTRQYESAITDSLSRDHCKVSHGARAAA
jgi:glycosyltransferase involved in cell wall biosynthesis